MEKAEIQRIASLLGEIQEDVFEMDGTHALQFDLNELYQVIKTLMDLLRLTKNINLSLRAWN